jgi:hypothetical protein
MELQNVINNEFINKFTSLFFLSLKTKLLPQMMAMPGSVASGLVMSHSTASSLTVSGSATSGLASHHKSRPISHAILEIELNMDNCQ